MFVHANRQITKLWSCFGGKKKVLNRFKIILASHHVLPRPDRTENEIMFTVCTMYYCAQLLRSVHRS